MAKIYVGNLPFSADEAARSLPVFAARDGQSVALPTDRRRPAARLRLRRNAAG